MSYQGQTWVDEVALPHLRNGGELLVMLRVANHAGNGPKKMSGCTASAATIARECLMGRSTVLKHLRELTRRALLVPGDPALVAHLPIDKRPPVHDLAGAHEPGCIGGHTFIAECRTAGVQIEHPPKKPRSAGGRFDHPPVDEGGSTGVAGVQIETQRVFKSSTNSSKELKEFSLSPEDPPLPGAPGPSAEAEKARETAAPKDNHTAAPAAAGVPQQRQEITSMVMTLPGIQSTAEALDIEPLVLDALEAGWALPHLRSHLARKCDPARVFDVCAVYRMHLKRLPEPSGAGALGAPRKDCSDCQGTGLLEDPVTFLPAGKCACRTAPAMA